MRRKGRGQAESLSYTFGGTHERTSAESVRENRASAVLRTSLPKIGTFSLIASHCLRPSSELIHRRNATAAAISPRKTAHQSLRQTFEMSIRICVGAGSVPPSYRLRSRLFEMCTNVVIDGEDYRRRR